MSNDRKSESGQQFPVAGASTPKETSPSPGDFIEGLEHAVPGCYRPPGARHRVCVVVVPDEPRPRGGKLGDGEGAA